MDRHAFAKRQIVPAALCAVLSVWALSGIGERTPVGVAYAQEKAKGDKQPPAKVWYYVPVEKCGKCHSEDKPTDLCPMNSNKLWSDEANGDKHGQAFKVLKGKRGERMTKLLGYDVTKADQCLACHGPGAELEAKNLAAEKAKKSPQALTADEIEAELKSLLDPPGKDKAESYEDIRLKDGVGCAVCHGTYKAWVVEHANILGDNDWRNYSGAMKEAYGMRDLRNPVTRAEMCMSCHVGNAKEGRVVTHEMYAAGHPPLPGIEIATFCGKNMPRHWDLLRNTPVLTKSTKPEFQRLYHYAPGLLEESRTSALSGVVALRETAKLLRDQSAKCVRNLGQKTPNAPVVLGLESFNCYACHHELQVPSWRQERGYPTTPGRPTMPDWPVALVPLGIRQVVGDDEAAYKAKSGEFEKLLADLRAAFDAQPYGNPGKVEAAADKLVAWLGDGSAPKSGLLAEMAAKGPFDKAAARLMLKEAADQIKKPYLDYDSARQLLWAYKIIFEELKATGGFGKAETGEIDAIEKMFNTEKTGLTARMKLDLKKGRGEISPIHDTENGQPADLKRTLDALNGYTPAQFKADLAALAKATEALLAKPAG
jgi:hypothetical protein